MSTVRSELTGFETGQEPEFSVFFKTSRSHVWPTQFSFDWYWGSLPGVKRPGREAIHWPFSTKVKNDWSYNFSPYMFSWHGERHLWRLQLQNRDLMQISTNFPKVCTLQRLSDRHKIIDSFSTSARLTNGLFIRHWGFSSMVTWPMCEAEPSAQFSAEGMKGWS
jgi:hypothetical protein